MIGRILSILSSIKLRMYSLFQKYNALSATYKRYEKCQRSQGRGGTESGWHKGGSWYLKVGAGDTLGDLLEERLLDFFELCWFNDI